MVPPCGSQERKKAPPFSEKELRVLIALYCANYSKYHGKHPGSRSTYLEKERLLEEWVQELSHMEVAPRTKAQVEEKLRNEVKRIQRHLKMERQRRSGSWSGKLPAMTALPSYLDPLVQILTKTHTTDGISGREGTSKENHMGMKDESDLVNEESSDNELFDHEGKPTLAEIQLQNLNSGSWNEKIREATMWQERQQQEEFNPQVFHSAASLAGEILNCSRLQLCEEEMKLAKIRQEEATMAVEVRKLEIEKLKLEIELLRKRTESEDSNYI